jgi:hypothetical protein
MNINGTIQTGVLAQMVVVATPVRVDPAPVSAMIRRSPTRWTDGVDELTVSFMLDW